MPIRRALLSVSNKTGLLDFARALEQRGVQLLSTGGTYKALQDAGIAAQTVEAYTGSPEVMAGRVKTLHPRVHAGLLARTGIDETDLERLGAELIDLVVVNLYPFNETLARGNASFEELIENIDIGGPSMLRSAAKNHHRVTVCVDTADYTKVIEEMDQHGDVSPETRRLLAAKVFAHTAAYDGSIANWFTGLGEADHFPRSLNLNFSKVYGLRYGENPHQQGAFYREVGAAEGSLARAESLGSGGKELSFNNLVDAEAAVEAVRDFPQPAAVVIKHASPCGVATAQSLTEAYRAAREADSLSAFGGIVALNREVDRATAALLGETFLECVVAPGFSADALELLRQKKALRLLATGKWLPADYSALQFKRVGGGLAVQSRDSTGSSEVQSARVVTQRAPSASERAALEFAWVVCKHVRSNAIVLASAGASTGAFATLGIGGGQTARVTAVEQACAFAKDRARGSVLASDAFFPFPDGLEAAARAGVAAVVQPGGSKADADVIAAADRAGVAMLFTGVRHFRH
ncbi:MAG TPA: bifunctional phosphoribosylaminoimidazolecarboxamide formyltransferase/IMP cyclohydrolase [Polyangiaceae bacterium]|nr:bifunctional phosphoribosylaminoimidazolecarboxamide formyltransferase/IMP cyclohydrolase [Polyangiaceae bacterium]